MPTTRMRRRAFFLFAAEKAYRRAVRVPNCRDLKTEAQATLTPESDKQEKISHTQREINRSKAEIAKP